MSESATRPKPPPQAHAAARPTRVRGLVKPLGDGGVAALLAVLFFILGAEVEGDTRALDDLVPHAASSLRSAYPVIATVMRDVGALGSTTVLTMVVAVGTG